VPTYRQCAGKCHRGQNRGSTLWTHQEISTFKSWIFQSGVLGGTIILIRKVSNGVIGTCSSIAQAADASIRKVTTGNISTVAGSGVPCGGLPLRLQRRRSLGHRRSIELLITSALLLTSGCAGGTGLGPQGQPGTKPRTYAISVSGSSGPLHHSLSLTLTVQ
jgi:hypothetical protein